MKKKIVATIISMIMAIQCIPTLAQAQVVNIREEIVEGIYNIDNIHLSEITTFSTAPIVYKAVLSAGNTASGMYMYSEMMLSGVVSTLGVKDRTLQEKVFFGYTNREVAPDCIEYNESSLYKSYIFTYREVGKTYRVKCTQYYIYGGQTYSYYNETPSFTYEIF